MYKIIGFLKLPTKKLHPMVEHENTYLKIDLNFMS